VPESPAAAERARDADRRRRAVIELRLAASTAEYAGRQIANGLGPEAARRAALDAAGELELIAGTLRRLALDPAERRRLIAELASSGLSQRRIAGQIGLSRWTVRGYLRATPARRGTQRGSRLAAQDGP
jgi:DNA-binding NarL/FixJ family response regulator